MTKPELVTFIAQKAEITKKAATVVLETFVKTIQSSLTEPDGKIRVSDLGTFRVIKTRKRLGVNPQTGKKMTIPAMKLARFSPSKALVETVRGKG